MGPARAHLEANPRNAHPAQKARRAPGARPALPNFSQWRATQCAPEAGSGCHEGHRGGLGTPLEGTYFQAKLGNAICVQSLDDSLNSAIHITYRISLRSSSLREPRYPSTGVVVRVVGVRARRTTAATKAARRATRAHGGVGRRAGSRPDARGDDDGRTPSRTTRALTLGRMPTRPQPARSGKGARRGQPRPGARLAAARNQRIGRGPVRTGFGMDTGNDPSAGSPTETLLRLLLPLNDKVHSSSHIATRIWTRHGPKYSPDHSIGRSDGRCVQRAGT